MEFQIWVDADSVPQTHRSIILRCAKRLDLPCLFVADRSLPDIERFIADDTHALRTQNPELGKTIRSKIKMTVVPTGADSADTHIVENALPGDLCITHDIPLASRLLPKGCAVIDDRGGTYTNDNIRNLISNRAVNAELRSWGVFSEQQRRMDKSTVKDFSDNLDRTVTALRSKEGK